MNSDTLIYTSYHKMFSELSLAQAYENSNMEILSTTLIWFLSKISANEHFYIASIWLISSIVLIKSLRLIQDPFQTLVFYFATINSPLFFSYLMVGTRQGLSMLFLFSALTLLLGKRYKLFYFALAAAPLFHETAIPCVLILLMLRALNLSVRLVVGIWVAFAILFLTGLNQSIFSFLSKYIADVQLYTSSSFLNNYSGVNRVDFLFFSFAVLTAGVLLNRFWMKGDPNYKIILNAYTLFNVYFLIFGFISFSNRVSAFSWYLIPLLLLYPFVNKPRYQPMLVTAALGIVIIIGFISGAVDMFI